MTESASSLCYCINPRCSDRENAYYDRQCAACQTPLLVQERYRLLHPLRSLEERANAELFEVEDLNPHDEQAWGTRKVLKVLQHNSNPDWVRLFKQEARALISLRHPGIPQVDPGGCFEVTLPRIPRRPTTKPLHCLVMEKIEGQDLEQWLTQHGAVSSEQAIAWLQQLATILQQVHHYDILHRDIKPANIMRRPDGQLTLIDFGAVSLIDRGSTLISSLGYTAPEQAQGITSVRSDFFGLGRTLVHLVTGVHPCDLPTDPTTGALQWRDRVSPLPPWFADLLDRLMDLQPDQRPASAVGILQWLSDQQSPALPVDESTRSPDSIGSTRSMAAPRWSWLGWLKPGAALLLAAGVVGSMGITSEWANQQAVEHHTGGRLPEAQKLYTLALQLNPNNAGAHYNQGVLDEQQQNFPAAIAHYRQSLQDPSYFAIATNNLSRLYITRQQNYAAAVELLLPALPQARDTDAQYSILKNLGWARLNQGQLDQGIASLQQAIALNGKRAPAHCLLAESLELQNKPQVALQSWRECLRWGKATNPDEDTWIAIARQKMPPPPPPPPSQPTRSSL